MPDKVYENVSESDYGSNEQWRIVRQRIGQTGRSHSVPRPYHAYTGSFYNTGDSTNYMNHLTSDLSYDGMLYRAFTHNEVNRFHNKMVEKLRDAIGPSSGLGASIIAEGGEAVEQVVKSMTEIANVAKFIRRPDLKRLKKVWKGRRRVQEAMAEAGGRWLEFSWGWSPMVSTVYDTLEVLSKDYPPQKVTVRHSATKSGVVKRYYMTSNDYLITKTNCSIFRKSQYLCTVTNGNEWLANSLDLINPGTWVWEAIPFSWLADYFINVGDMIGGLSQFAGVHLQHLNTSDVMKGSREETWTEHRNVRAKGTVTINDFSRTLIDPGTSIRMTYNLYNPFTTSAGRAANMSAFLAAQLSK